MDKDNIIRQLKHENESLKTCIKEYDNTHTPLRLKRNGNRKKDQNEGGRNKTGQKKGHKGVTRPPAKLGRQVEITKDRCPDCGTELGDPFSVETKVIEEIPEPQPVIVTEYKIAHHTCPHCQKEPSEIVPLLAVLRLIESDVLLAYRDLESQRLIQNKADPNRSDNCVHHRNRGSFELQEELV
jgi:predicted RNA-binding Zn-ribbon protein involved in translation (DUF1610 family)